jgi:hypothetical protein
MSRAAVKPTRQDFSVLNVGICGFTGVVIVVLNTKFKLVSFCTLIQQNVDTVGY